MAKQRVVSTYFWNDPFIMKLRPDEKLLFLYALTNPQTDLCGAYELALDKIVFETKMSERKILEVFAKFEAAEKICYRNGWVFIKNFAKHQQGNSPNVKKGAERSLSLCPDWVKETLAIGFQTPSIENALLLLPIGITSRENLTEQPIPRPDGLSEIAYAIPPAPKPPKSKKPPRDERLDHPAIKAVLEVSSKYPLKDLWNRIIREIGDKPDIAFMTACFETWRALNGSPMNLEKWLFEPHKTGMVPEVFGMGKRNGTGNYKSAAERSGERSLNGQRMADELERQARDAIARRDALHRNDDPGDQQDP